MCNDRCSACGGRGSLTADSEGPSEFVERVVGGIDPYHESRLPAERTAALVWFAVGLVSGDGWPEWFEALGPHTAELVNGLRGREPAL